MKEKFVYLLFAVVLIAAVALIVLYKLESGKAVNIINSPVFVNEAGDTVLQEGVKITTKRRSIRSIPNENPSFWIKVVEIEGVFEEVDQKGFDYEAIVVLPNKKRVKVILGVGSDLLSVGRYQESDDINSSTQFTVSKVSEFVEDAPIGREIGMSFVVDYPEEYLLDDIVCNVNRRRDICLRWLERIRISIDKNESSARSLKDTDVVDMYYPEQLVIK